MTIRASWNGVVLAESDRTIKVEGNHYFPAEDVDTSLLQPTAKHTVCHWKGEASYWDVVVAGERNSNAAWTYINPSPAASEITGYVAFWKGVKVKRVADDSSGGDCDRGSRWSRMVQRVKS